MRILQEYEEIHWDLPFLQNLGNLEYLKDFSKSILF